MKSNFLLGKANIVVLARNYNPSIVSKEWLYSKNIIKETVDNFVHTPVLSVIETTLATIILEEGRFQISLKHTSPENIDALSKIATKFVMALPETPYVATGFNHNYHIFRKDIKTGKISKPNYAKLKELFGENYDIGQLVYFQFREFVVRMSIAPTKGDADKLAASFNFHSDVAGVEAIVERLSLHTATVERTQEILKELSK